MKKLNLNKQRGFTLIELLIVVAILGITMGAIYSLYTTHQRSAYVSDEVVEVQQNLRIAIDSMTRDIRMAGFMLPLSNMLTPTSTPISTASNATEITINMGSSDSTGPFATIAQPRAGLGSFIVTTQVSVDQFNLGDIVTIVRPNANNLAVGGVGNRFTVVGTDRVNRIIQLQTPPPIGSIDTNADYREGDLIVRTGAAFPNQIRYCLGPTTCPAPGCPAGQQCLMKIVNGGAGDIIAQNIAPVAFCPPLGCLQISYLLDNGAETNAPTALPGPTSFNEIRAVRVTLNGQTVTTRALSDNVARDRQVESVIEIRNKFNNNN